MCVFVLTDGMWWEETKADQTIRDLVVTLEDFGMPVDQVGIQFVRFGNEEKGAQRLRHLDDG